LGDDEGGLEMGGAWKETRALKRILQKCDGVANGWRNKKCTMIKRKRN
jgi:hypothetical protein